MVKIGNDWDRVLDGEFDKEYYLKLREFLKEEYKSHTVYPDMYDIFNALKYTHITSRARHTACPFPCKRVLHRRHPL